jgi:hypothetical protein
MRARVSIDLEYASEAAELRERQFGPDAAAAVHAMAENDVVSTF